MREVRDRGEEVVKDRVERERASAEEERTERSSEEGDMDAVLRMLADEMMRGMDMRVWRQALMEARSRLGTTVVQDRLLKDQCAEKLTLYKSKKPESVKVSASRPLSSREALDKRHVASRERSIL